MSNEPTTATALRASQTRSQSTHAMQRLLHKLKPFMRAYTRTPDTEMPEHDIVWVTEVESGPQQVIAEAMEATPALWLETLPPEVVIVPRKALESTARLTPEVIDYLAGMGMNIVASRGARRLHEADFEM